MVLKAMTGAAFHILRVGLGITFVWIGLLILKDPVGWAQLVQPWIWNFLVLPPETTLMVNAVFDIAVGLLLLMDLLTWLVSLLAVLHLVVVLIAVGIDPITVRDIGLLAGALALFAQTCPAKLKFWLKNKK